MAGNGNFATAYNIHERSVAMAWDNTFKSSLLNEVRFGFNRDYAHSDPIGLKLGTSLAAQLWVDRNSGRSRIPLAFRQLKSMD